ILGARAHVGRALLDPEAELAVERRPRFVERRATLLELLLQRSPRALDGFRRDAVAIDGGAIEEVRSAREEPLARREPIAARLQRLPLRALELLELGVDALSQAALEILRTRRALALE